MALFSRNPYLPSLVFAASFATAQEPLPPIQFNVPYRCADGTTYVIERCVPARKGEVCNFRIEMAGQLPTEAYNIRSQLTGILNTCPAQASPQGAHQLNPPYLREMPPVERVKSQIQGSNPIDTIAPARRRWLGAGHGPRGIVQCCLPERRSGSVVTCDCRLSH